MSNFIADAVIIVRADTKPFLAEFQKVVAAAEKTQAEVKIIPNPKGFVAEVNRVVKAMSFAPARVRIVPDPKGFRTALLKIISETAATLPPVTVGVTAASTGRAAAGGGAASAAGGGDRRVATAQQAIARATDAGIAARRKFTDVLVKGDRAADIAAKRATRLVREELALKAATEAVSRAAVSGVPALLAEAEALERTARAAVLATQAQIERAAAAASAPAAAAAAAAAAEAKALEEVAAETARIEALKQKMFGDTSAKRIAAKDAEVAAIIAAINRELAVEKAALAELDAERAASAAKRKALNDALLADAARFADEQKLLARSAPVIDEATQINKNVIESEREIANAQQLRAKAARQLVGVSQLAGGEEQKLAALRAVERTNTAALTAAEVARNEALASGIPTKIASAEAEVALAKAQQQTILTEVNATAAAVARQGQLGAGRRALEAFAANLAGLRGAALSAQGAFVATAAAAIALTKAVQGAAELESTFNVFKVTAGASAQQMERVQAVAKALGRDLSLPGVSAQDAAEALTQLSKAGLTVENSIDGARGVLQLATAAAIDNAQATELAASALNAFGLAGNQAVRVADVLANAANASQGSIVDIGVALQQSAAVARQAGLTLEQTVAVLTLFARAGLKGSDAGTSFRTALIRLINPTTKAQKEIDKLGLSLRTSTGAIDLDVFQQFTDATRNFTAAQRDQALAIIFGQDAIRGAAILAREGTAGLDRQVEGLKEQGSAAELAAARMTGFTGSLENLKNQLSSLGNAIGAALIPPLTVITDTMATGINIVNTYADGFALLVKNATIAGNLVRDFPDLEIAGVKISGDDNQEKGFLDKVRDVAIDAAKERLKRPPGTEALTAAEPFIEMIQKSREFKGESEEVAAQIREILSLLNQSSDEVQSGLNFTRVIGQLTELQNKLAGGDEEAQRLSGVIADILSQLKEGTTLPPFKFPQVELPPEVESGKPGKEAGENILQAFDDALPPTEVYSISFNAFDQIGQGISDAAANAATIITGVIPALMAQVQGLITQGITAITGNAQAKIGALQEQALDLELANASPAQRIANLNREFAQQQKFIDATANAKDKETVEERRKAKERQVAIIKEIEGIEEERDNAVTKAARDAKEARDEADKAFFDSLDPGREELERRSIRAESSDSLKAQRAVLLAEKKRIQQEIVLIDQNVKDRKVADAEIDKRKTELVQIDADIEEKTREIAERTFERKQATLQARQSAAQAVGDITGQIRIVNRRIREYNNLIRAGKLEGEALRKAIQSRDELKRDREQLKEDFAQANIDLGQSIFDLTGNKTPLLKAIDAAIAIQLKEIAAAKRAGRSTVVLQTELNRLLKQRKDLLEETSEENSKQGTTVFELLRQSAETFNQNAGSLIDPSQTIAGATGFTADIAGFFKRRKPVGIGSSRLTDRRVIEDDGLTKVVNVTNKQIQTTDELIATINNWIATINAQSGNSSTRGLTTAAVNALGARGQAMGAFWKARQSRMAEES
jgi:TP901 family phage tail tape measure protein